MYSKLSPTVLTILSVFLLCSSSFGQETEQSAKKINFSYSRNPVTRVKSPEKIQDPAQEQVIESTVSENSTPENSTSENASENNSTELTIAKKTLEVAKRGNKNSMPPTEIYKVGVGDVLFISVQNAPSKNSTYFTVLNDGTIDYALAGEMVPVLGLTTEEIEELLREKIKVYENPQLSVKVREYASHAITVLGMVEKSGEKFLQREAVPLFVVKAEAIVESKVTQAIIRRGNSQLETVDLRDPKSDEILILPGDIIEFSIGAVETKTTVVPQFYYIGGEIMKVGQQNFYSGITLTQAILASGGLRKENARFVVIRRKNAEGLLVPTEYNLREIKIGRIPDPLIEAGDTIEIVK